MERFARSQIGEKPNRGNLPRNSPPISPFPLTNAHRVRYNILMLNITPEVERQVRRGIRRLLTERNISMRRLAKQANIPQTSLYYFLTGKYRYRHVYALAIAQVLGVSVKELARIGAIELEANHG